MSTTLTHSSRKASGVIPMGWHRVCLGDVAERCLGKMLDAKKNKGKPFPYLRNPNVKWFSIDLSDLREMPFEEHELQRFGVRRGDVLICEGGEAGRAAIWESDRTDVKIQKAIHRVRCGPDLHNRFIVHRLMYDYFSGRLNDYYTGTTIKHFTGQDLAKYELLLPPLAEQKRIAGILDAADALRTKRREALAQLDILLQSTFLDLFGDPVANPKRWSVAELGEHTVKVGSGATPTGGEDSYKTAGIALIRSMNVRDGSFLWDGLARIDDVQAAKLDNVVVDADDVLLNITGASVARVCRAPFQVLPARVNQHVCIIRPSKSINPKYLEKLLLSGSMKHKLLGIGESGATRQAITKAEVLTLIVPIPPLSAQERFADIVKSLEEQSAAQKNHLAELDALFASLQSRAFRGEL